MTVKKKTALATFDETREWLFKRVASAPRPLPSGRFPVILQEAVREGFSRELLLNALDMWLNYGYCRIIDPIAQDIELTEEGMRYFY